MVRYPFKKPEAQNIVPKKREKIMKKNKNFFRVSALKTAIFVEFDEKNSSAGTSTKSSGSIANTPRIPPIPKALKKDENVNPKTNPFFNNTKVFKIVPALKNADMKIIKNITKSSLTALSAVLYLFIDAVLFKKAVR